MLATRLYIFMKLGMRRAATVLTGIVEPVPAPGRLVKQSRGTRFAILDGGINHLLRPLLTGQPFPVRAFGGEGLTGPRMATVLAGPLCTGLDRLGEVDLPVRLAPGDLLAFGMTGAYGRSEGMTHFLSHPVPAEVVLP